MRLKNVKVCKNIFCKAFGLMFSRPRNIVFIFKKERYVSLHMFFVFFPITALFLDFEKKVVEIKRLKPWQMYFPKKKARYVVEVVEKVNVRVGERVRF